MLLNFIVIFSLIKVLESYYFIEDFDDEEFHDRWVQSLHPTYKFGILDWSTSLNHYFDKIKHKGIRTTQGKKHYAYSGRLRNNATVDSNDQPFVFQFQLKTETAQTCSGGYLKVLPRDFNEFNFSRFTNYYVLFGPDGCEDEGKAIKIVLNYKNKYYKFNGTIISPDDTLTHLYTLIFYPNNKFLVKIDNEDKFSGKITASWDLTLPEYIPDPNAVKPANWDGRETIPIPREVADVNESSDDVDDYIADESVKKPEDWEDEFDGKWEPPVIPNPKKENHRYKPVNQNNPNYSGVWSPPMIKNPDFVKVDYPYDFPEIGGIGIEMWQLAPGSVFDNIILTSDPKLAEKSARRDWRPLYEYEKRQIELDKMKTEMEAHEDL